jgi:TPR repeat protein/DNA-binding XRE family transcriptional regulator
MELTIGDNIKRLRTEKNLTQKEVANAAGVSTRAVSKWECGKAYPDITLLPTLAAYFGVTADELLGTAQSAAKSNAKPAVTLDAGATELLKNIYAIASGRDTGIILFGDGEQNTAQFGKAELDELKKAAESGDADAIAKLSDFYYKTAVYSYNTKDYEMSAKLYRNAAELGHTGACINLGVQYHFGKGLLRDYEQAMYWYTQSDTVPGPYGTGNPWARCNIGDLYRDGFGVDRDYAAALEWYQKSADLEFPLADLRIGELYERGLGVERDLRVAAKYYEKAANPSTRFDGWTVFDEGDDPKVSLARVRALL